VNSSWVTADARKLILFGTLALSQSLLTSAATDPTRTDLIDDLTLLPLPPWWQTPWVMAGAALALVLLAILVWMLRRFLRRKIVALDLPPMRPDLHSEFLRRLAELRARRSQLTDYALAIASSDILRDYLEWRFQLAIRYQTTGEFLASSRENMALAEAQREQLGNYLRLCDRVKFARHGASTAEQDHLLDAAESFIQNGADAKGAVVA
jgi:hypothetical protein